MTVMSDIIAGNPDLAAVFALNDDMGVGAMEALKAAGRQDVLVIGFNERQRPLRMWRKGVSLPRWFNIPKRWGGCLWRTR